MYRPLTTGQVAAQLGTTEPRINDLLRRGKISPAPPVVAGRRLWSSEHLEAAAEAVADADGRAYPAESFFDKADS